MPYRETAKTHVVLDTMFVHEIACLVCGHSSVDIKDIKMEYCRKCCSYHPVRIMSDSINDALFRQGPMNEMNQATIREVRRRAMLANNQAVTERCNRELSKRWSEQ